MKKEKKPRCERCGQFKPDNTGKGIVAQIENRHICTKPWTKEENIKAFSRIDKEERTFVMYGGVKVKQEIDNFFKDIVLT